jgi:hypothetical protein
MSQAKVVEIDRVTCKSSLKIRWYCGICDYFLAEELPRTYIVIDPIIDVVATSYTRMNSCASDAMDFNPPQCCRNIQITLIGRVSRQPPKRLSSSAYSPSNI